MISPTRSLRGSLCWMNVGISDCRPMKTQPTPSTFTGACHVQKSHDECHRVRPRPVASLATPRAVLECSIPLCGVAPCVNGFITSAFMDVFVAASCSPWAVASAVKHGLSSACVAPNLPTRGASEFIASRAGARVFFLDATASAENKIKC